MDPTLTQETEAPQISPEVQAAISKGIEQATMALAMRGEPTTVKRENGWPTHQDYTPRRTWNLSGNATPFGCCNFFDRCGDGDLISLHMAGQTPLLDWLGFNVSDVCYRVMEYISFVRPARAINGTPTPGYLESPCDDPAGVEWGSCKLTVDDFGDIGRKGPTRPIMKPMKYCLTDPLWRLDGTRVVDEREWDMKFIADQILADVNLLVVEGSSANAGSFDGLQRIVKNGYDCSSLDSVIIDWNGNGMDGGAGITWNGAPVAATFDFIDVLLAAYRRIKQRQAWSPILRTKTAVVGDAIIVMPNSMIPCLLDFFTCWNVCPGAEFNVNSLQTMEARTYRNSLMGGLFGQGRIFVDGFEIPILGYDWGMINGPTTGDIYLLWGSLGNYRIWEGEHISAATAVSGNPEQGYFSTDGGRLLWKVDVENQCRIMKGWIHPRLFCRAPWMQVRFQDVKCVQPGGFLSADPDDTSFYPLTSFSQAECPPGGVPGVH